MNRLDYSYTCNTLFTITYFFQYVDANLSQKILSAAREQQRQMEDELDVSDSESRKPKTVTLGSHDSDDEASEPEEENQEQTDTFYESLQIDEDDEKAMEKFMSKNPAPRRTLADIIMEKITEKQTEVETQFSDAGSIKLQDIDPRVKQMYEGVRDVLRKYRSGKLPKAFKIIPNLRNWEQILYITGKFYEYFLRCCD